MKKFLRISLALFSLILFSFALSGCREAGMNPTTSPGSSPSPSTQTPPLSEGQALPVAILETEKGTIKFEMYPDDAFNTVSNFIYLAKKGFYDGLTFHRVEPGFVIQGGDPNGNGTGGPGYHIKAEFNSRKHLEGTVAMARADDPDSAGSQFYICLSSQPHLDGKYTVFGQVIEGMDVVKRIQVGDKIINVRLENAEGYPEPEKLP